MLQNINDLDWESQDLRALLTRLVQFGEVSEVQGQRVRVRLPGQGGMSSAWLQVGTRRAKGVSQVHTYEIGEQVACLFQPMGDGSTGVVLFALHNDQDTPWTDSADIEGVRYANGTRFSYDMAKDEVTLSLANDAVSLVGSPDGWVFKGKVTFEDETRHKQAVTCEATLSAQGTISSAAELADGKGTVSRIREVYDDHDHDYNDGVTGKPNQGMNALYGFLRRFWRKRQRRSLKKV